MKTGISVAIRHFIEQHIVADDPLPERSWLDQRDMPHAQEPSKTAVAGLPVDPLAPLRGRQAGHGRHPQRLRRMVRGQSRADGS
ncbi:hypothetical protein ACFVTE_09420 [Arthrobacter sp. NPDC058097]|uniref:hypothetical protein n=1 Tax=Arthrobacter sp. NPDC058097 TaxID=3346340 RepID=UPI0036DA7E8D